MLYLRYLQGRGQSRIMSSIFSWQRKIFKSNLTPKMKFCLPGLIMSNNFDTQRKSFQIKLDRKSDIMPHWPQAAGQFCDPLDICSRELVEDSLIFPENHTERYVNCEKNSERTSFTWIVLTLCNLEDSCHSTCPTWSDIPPGKVIPPKKISLGLTWPLTFLLMQSWNRLSGSGSQGSAGRSNSFTSVRARR